MQEILNNFDKLRTNWRKLVASVDPTPSRSSHEWKLEATLSTNTSARALKRRGNTHDFPSTLSITPVKPRASAVMRHLPTAGRVLMGLTFFVFGLDGFLHFVPQPTEGIPEGAMAFGLALAKTGYMFQFIKGTEVVAGALLLLNRFVPLALAIIAPVVLNIFAFHLFLSPSELGIAFIILALELYLAWTYRDAFRPMLAARVES